MTTPSLDDTTRIGIGPKYGVCDECGYRITEDDDREVDIDSDSVFHARCTEPTNKSLESFTEDTEDTVTCTHCKQQASNVGDHGYCDDCKPPNPTATPQRSSPLECGCPNCSSPKHEDLVVCMNCYHNDCDPYKQFGVNCE